jgi:hypothetical protein
MREIMKRPRKKATQDLYFFVFRTGIQSFPRLGQQMVMYMSKKSDGLVMKIF